MAVQPRTRRLLPLLLLLAAIGLSGCRPAPATSPHSALTAYTDALEEGRLDDAYRLLSAESRAQLSLVDFKKLVRTHPKEVESLLKAASAEEAPPLVTAEFESDAGHVLTLIFEDGEWRIDQTAVNLYDQTEPRAALSAFVRAYDRKRYDILLRFVPEAQKEGLTEEILKSSWEGEQRIEMEQIVEGLRAQITTATIERLGERATMSYGAGGLVELVLENGAWKIEDLQ